jgi:sugar lactone lactonase YvrE
VEPILPLERASVFVDGTVGEVRLNHPEGVAVDRAGDVWCGGETGELYRIAADGSRFEVVASTGGFVLGLAFDARGRLFACDLGHKAVFRFDPATGDLRRFTPESIAPAGAFNFPVVDTRRNCLYVSDSHPPDVPGPGVWRFDLESGEGGPWYAAPTNFANGMALSLDRETLYVIETFARRVIRVPIGPDGSAGAAEVFVEGIERLPDGLAFDVDGNLYIACYEPSRLFRVDPGGKLDLLIDDPEAHTMCHPTNCAFRGTELFTANLGRWHVTRIEVGVAGAPLP